MMTQDPREAHELAEQLDSLNRRRRAIEDRILREAIDVYEASPQSRQDALGIVLASDGWHAGVVGIVASRVVERLRRPVVLVALDGERGQGSGRSIEAFDLHAALAPERSQLLSILRGRIRFRGTGVFLSPAKPVQWIHLRYSAREVHHRRLVCLLPLR